MNRLNVDSNGGSMMLIHFFSPWSSSSIWSYWWLLKSRHLNVKPQSSKTGNNMNWASKSKQWAIWVVNVSELARGGSRLECDAEKGCVAGGCGDIWASVADGCRWYDSNSNDAWLTEMWWATEASIVYTIVVAAAKMSKVLTRVFESERWLSWILFMYIFNNGYIDVEMIEWWRLNKS